MQLSIDGEGHLSFKELTDAQMVWLRRLAAAKGLTLAEAAVWAVEDQRQEDRVPDLDSPLSRQYP